MRGQSTFMVEMSETSAILHTATSASLVLLDEIGRVRRRMRSVIALVGERIPARKGGARQCLQHNTTN